MAINECPFDEDVRYVNICLALRRINRVGACGSMLSLAEGDGQGELGALRFQNMISTAGDMLEADIEHNWSETKKDGCFRPQIEAASQIAGFSDSWSWGAAHHFLSCKLYKEVIVYSLNKGISGAPLRGPTDGLIKSLNYIKSSWQGFLHTPNSIDPLMFMGVLYAPGDRYTFIQWRYCQKFVIGSLPGMEIETKMFYGTKESPITELAAKEPVEWEC
tara:strand:- start:1962 stop:2615 length:654 start_codon:yes stop_codon:yes gene_type:complete